MHAIHWMKASSRGVGVHVDKLLAVGPPAGLLGRARELRLAQLVLAVVAPTMRSGESGIYAR